MIKRLFFSQPQGQILIFAIILVLIIFVLASALLSFSTFNLFASHQNYLRLQALSYAEAGVEKAVNSLNVDPAYLGEENTPFDKGAFTVKIISTGFSTSHLLQVTSYIPNATNPKIKKTVKVEVTTSTDEVNFRYGAQVGNGGLRMEEKVKILGEGGTSGNIFANGNVSGKGDVNNRPFITGDVYVAANPNSELPDQESYDPDSDQIIGKEIGGKKYFDLAQGFIPQIDGANLNKVSLYLKKAGNPGDKKVRILSDNNGKPSTQELQNGTLDKSLVGLDYSWIEVNFTSPWPLPYLTAETTYWLMIEGGDNNNDYYIWGKDSTDTYEYGTGKYSDNWKTANPSWADVGGDLAFETWMSGGVSLYRTHVGLNAYASKITSSNIDNNAYYQTIADSTVGGQSFPGYPNPEPQPMPIDQDKIDEWELAALNGGEINPEHGKYEVDHDVILGPVKINGDLQIKGNKTLTLTGYIWVNGDVKLDDAATIKLDPSFGNSGTVMIADYPINQSLKGRFDLHQNSNILGSGSPESYLLILSTNTSMQEKKPAIKAKKNSEAAIYYASQGIILLDHNATAKQLTGYAVKLKKEVVVTYKEGLARAYFGAGPGGSWKIRRGTWQVIN
jgi:hypothetical protein